MSCISKIAMIRLPAWAISVFLHACVVGGGLYLGHEAVSDEAPAVAAILNRRPTPIVIDQGREEVVVEFVPVEPVESPPLPLEDVPVVIEPEAVEPPVETARIGPSERPEPRFDRPLRTTEVLPRPKISESAPEIKAEVEAEAILNPPPHYPLAARRMGLEGEVVVQVSILADGTCVEPKVVESTGCGSFVEAAMTAIRKWRYRPATQAGLPVASSQRVRFVFRLKA